MDALNSSIKPSLALVSEKGIGAFSVVLWLDSTVLFSYICCLNFHCVVHYWATVLRPSRGFNLRSHSVMYNIKNMKGKRCST